MATAAASTAREVKIVGIISSAHALSHFYFLVLPPILPLLKAEFQVSYAALGLLMTGYGLAAGVIQTPVGFIVDRIGGRPSRPLHRPRAEKGAGRQSVQPAVQP